MRVEELDYLTSDNVKNILLNAGGEVRNFRVGAQKDKYLQPKELIEDFLQTVKSSVRSIQKLARESITKLCCTNIRIDRGEYCKDKISDLKKNCRTIDDELNELILFLFYIEGVVEKINI